MNNKLAPSAHHRYQNLIKIPFSTAMQQQKKKFYEKYVQHNERKKYVHLKICGEVCYSLLGFNLQIHNSLFSCCINIGVRVEKINKSAADNTKKKAFSRPINGT